jgi:polysaccharide deacetylase 2 family uncharacterized protein YibQ
LGVALLAVSCRKKPQPSTAPISRRTALGLLRQAVLRAGGEQVWVKGSATGEFPSPAQPVRVLAEPSAFEKVLGALRRAAARHALAVESAATFGPNGQPIATLRISEARSWQSEWRVRQVPRLLRAAIIIDDMGANEVAARKLLSLPYPLTFSVLPHLRYSVETADQAFRAGRDVMLHLPMEPIARPGIFSSPDQIRVGMGARAVRRLIQADLRAVPHASGVNNHQGSRATADPELMAEVMEVLAARRLYFVDSRTIGSSVAYQQARRAGVPAVFRSVFLDDTQRVAYTLGQLRDLERVVRRQGVALAIGHPHPTTLRALQEFLPNFAKDDIELVPVSRMVRLPQAARLTPPRPVRAPLR